jgi:hypothetical protein
VCVIVIRVVFKVRKKESSHRRSSGQCWSTLESREKKKKTEIQDAGDQGDQIGRIFDHSVSVFYFGPIFCKLQK